MSRIDMVGVNPTAPVEATLQSGLRSRLVGSIGSALSSVQQSDSTSTAQASALNFASILSNALNEVEQAQKTSDEMTVGMLLGTVEIHQATVAMDKATLTLRTFVQVRDKMLEAYQEVMRMQI